MSDRSRENSSLCCAGTTHAALINLRGSSDYTTFVQTSGSRGAFPGSQGLFQLRELSQSLVVYRMSKMSLTPTLISVTVERVTVTYQLANLATIYNILHTALVVRLVSKNNAFKRIRSKQARVVSRTVIVRLHAITRCLATLDIGCQAAAGRNDAWCFQTCLHKGRSRLLPKDQGLISCIIDKSTQLTKQNNEL